MNKNRHYINFNTIEKRLICFSLSSKNAIIEDLAEDEMAMLWLINDQCNLDCEYCHHDNKANHSTFPDPQTVIQQFNRHDTTWFINISGGEPFVYKGFTELVKLLTKKHYLLINTNLTIDLTEFVSEVASQHIIGINASYHENELEKQPELQKQYFDNFNLLKKNGFNIVCSIVGFPPVLEKIDSIIEKLKKKEIDQIGIRNFTGTYNSKEYPDTYSPNEISKIQKYRLPILGLDFEKDFPNMKGRCCFSGNKYLFMNSQGNLFRCTSDGRMLGNFFTNDYKTKSTFSLCQIDTARCSYECLLCSCSNKDFFRGTIL